MKKHTIVIYSLCLDIVKILRNNFKAKITLESIFSRRNVLDFISKCTVKVGKDKFKVRDNIERQFYPSNTQLKYVLKILEDDIVYHQEALEPRVFSNKAPVMSENHVWPEDGDPFFREYRDFGHYLECQIKAMFGDV